MELSEIYISNYRSIKEVTFPIIPIQEKKCFMLIGMNESGKSNVLKAINLINTDQSFNFSIDCNNDAKKLNNNESDIDVYYSFNLSDSDLYIQNLVQQGLSEEIASNLKFENVYKNISINQSNKRTEKRFIEIENNTIFSKYFIDPGFSNIVDTKQDGFLELTTKNLQEYLVIKMASLLSQNQPKFIFWKSEERYLITNPIDLNLFKSDNNQSIPLKNIFHVAGIATADISKRIDLALSDIGQKMELEELLTTKITEHINTIWKEYKIQIRIRIDGTVCSVLVQDDDHKAIHNMAQRSDGFKQFISILINLSVEYKVDTLKNSIILLDEPETHLHPSGVKFLRDELLEISKANTVIVSTHSIYMVDKMSLDRHFKTYKEKGETFLSQIKNDNPYEEEVIYESLGTSIFEHLRENTIIFEGKTDKDLFDVFTNKFSEEIQPLNLSSVSADSASKVLNLTKFFDGKKIRSFILLDSDGEGIKEKAKIIKSSDYYQDNKTIFDINQIVNTKISASLEDLLPSSIISTYLQKQYNISMTFTKEPMVMQLENHNKKSGSKKIDIDKLKGDITKIIINEVQKTDLIKIKTKYSTYYKFLINLRNKIKAK